MDSYKTPAGYDLELDGENESTTEAMGQVMLMMALGIVLMYLIMVAQSSPCFRHLSFCLQSRLPLPEVSWDCGYLEAMSV